MMASDFKNMINRSFSQLSRAREKISPQVRLKEVGQVLSISSGIARVSGLPGVGFEELISFPHGVYGIAFNLDEKEIGVVLLGENENIFAGDEVYRTGRVMDIPVGDFLIGRIINPLGEPLDEKGRIPEGERLPIERSAPSIMDRAPVTVPLQTGIKLIDALIPVGRGQRELILGDRQTGKTAIAIDTILNQKDKNVLCIYCAIGQRASTVAKVIATLQENDALDYSIVLVTEGNDLPGLQFIAPFAATSIAESFIKQGRDVLIIYDDLTHHARAYRELSLLLRRPPGREAFPGDIFYLHSRLLERATHLDKDNGGGSLTALPIIETEAQNISAYIPTNLISITDGQIYMSPKLFEMGILPAVDIGKSVSRVGGKAQLEVYHAVAGDLKLKFAQFEELENFARFGTRLDEETRKIIAHGKRIRACFTQQESRPVSVLQQIIILEALTSGLMDEIPLEQMSHAEVELSKIADELPEEIKNGITSGEKLSEEDRKTILDRAEKAVSGLKSRAESSSEEEPSEETGVSEGKKPDEVRKMTAKKDKTEARSSKDEKPPEEEKPSQEKSASEVKKPAIEPEAPGEKTNSEKT